MKKVKTKQLVVNSETIRRLDRNRLDAVRGAVGSLANGHGNSCGPCDTANCDQGPHDQM